MSKIDDIANKTFTVDKNGNITNISIDVVKKNKELTPLKALEEIREDCDCGAFQRRCDIIETALKALEIIKEKAEIVKLDEKQYILLLQDYSIRNKKELNLLKEVLL